MNKPTIFFSHSAKDKKSISFLRNRILNIASNTIKIFQSSDGESIPFGNNWVHKIEENLNDSKLMFVFVTPNSIKSNWLYFESGFSYSKGVKVIPIGMNGIDIGQIGPPINLLQGFNISSHEALNNIISIINKEFESTYETNFKKDDFSKLNELSNNLYYNSLNSHIDHIFADFGKIQDIKLNPSPFETIVDYLKEKKIKHSVNNKKEIYLNGMVILKKENQIDLKIDEINLKESLEIINNVVVRIYDPPLKTFWFSIKFNENIDLLTSNFKLSSRLKLIGIEMSEVSGKLYNYKTIRFGLFKKTKYMDEQLRIVYDLDNFKYNDIFEIVEILFDNNLLKLR